MKTPASVTAEAARHRAAAPAESAHRSGRGAVSQRLEQTPRMVAQRQQLEAAFGAAVQRAAGPEEDELQMKPAGAAQLHADSTAPTRDGGLPGGLKGGIESLSGLPMDDVRVHYNSAQPAQLNALAYAQGRDIHLAPGQERHLPHEAWHVAQQAQGRVQPTMQMMEGTAINDDAALEREADVMGAKAAGG